MPKVIINYIDLPVDIHPTTKKMLTEIVKTFFEDLGYEVEQCHLV